MASQYPRWWAGSSDEMYKIIEDFLREKVSIPSLVGRLLGLALPGITPYLSFYVSIPSLVGRLLGPTATSLSAVPVLASQYPRWWAGSSDKRHGHPWPCRSQASLNTLAGGQAPRTVRLVSRHSSRSPESQYPRWWAGSSDTNRKFPYGLFIPWSQYPRWWAGSSDRVIKIIAQATVLSQYPRWWAGSSDSSTLEVPGLGFCLNTLAGGQAPRTQH